MVATSEPPTVVMARALLLPDGQFSVEIVKASRATEEQIQLGCIAIGKALLAYLDVSAPGDVPL